MQKNNGSRKIGRHARIAVKDTIMRENVQLTRRGVGGEILNHLGLFDMQVRAGDQGMHGTPQRQQKKSH